MKTKFVWQFVFLNLFFVPFVCIGIAQTALLVEALWALNRSDRVIATVVKAETAEDSSIVTLRVPFGTHETTVNTSADRSFAASLEKGQKIVVAVWKSDRIHAVIPRHTDTGMLFLFCFFWDGITTLMLIVIWQLYMGSRWLMKYGKAAVGVVIDVHESNDSDKPSTFTYEYPGQHGPIQGVQNLTASQDLKSVYKGLHVNVLYNPRKPGQAIVHGYEMFEIVTAA
jgi:hypothetical protein